MYDCRGAPVACQYAAQKGARDDVMEFILEKVVDAYGGGQKITLVVGERDGFVVIGLNEPGGARACLLDPADAGAVVPSASRGNRTRAKLSKA
jgi:hypothetical protein